MKTFPKKWRKQWLMVVAVLALMSAAGCGGELIIGDDEARQNSSAK